MKWNLGCGEGKDEPVVDGCGGSGRAEVGLLSSMGLEEANS
jgi:hypothetical protein